MRLHSRFARAKKGMSTIFGGLFFIIILLMGFNLMVWGFAQYDSYNQSLNKMSGNDQAAASENLVPANPGATGFNSAGSGSFNITVNNLGGSSVIITRIYITNISPTASNQCSTNPCIVDPSPGAATCVGGVNCNLSNNNIAVGEINHQIKVTGLLVNDGNGYKVILASTRGRLFSFYYPWPQASPSGGSGGTFVTNIGPLNIYFDFKSFNYTQQSQTQSQPAWCVPTSHNLIFWIKVANAATDSSVTLKKSTVIFPQPYSSSGGGGQFGPFYVVDKNTLNPNAITAYNEATNPYVLPAANANGPSAFVIVKFGATIAGGTTGNNLFQDDFWLVFIGFNYIYQGSVQGQTIPFVAMKSSAGAPGSC